MKKIKLSKDKLQERLSTNLMTLFKYCAEKAMKITPEEEKLFTILTEEIIDWIEKVDLIDGDEADRLKENNLGEYVHLSYYGSPLNDEVKRKIEISPNEVEGIEFYYIDEQALDDVAKDIVGEYSFDYQIIFKDVFMKSILEVLNNKI
jgi:hypothetical protein